MNLWHVGGMVGPSGWILDEWILSDYDPEDEWDGQDRTYYTTRSPSGELWVDAREDDARGEDRGLWYFDAVYTAGEVLRAALESGDVPEKGDVMRLGDVWLQCRREAGGAVI